MTIAWANCETLSLEARLRNPVCHAISSASRTKSSCIREASG